MGREQPLTWTFLLGNTPTPPHPIPVLPNPPASAHPTLCQPFKGHFLFLSRWPSCLSGMIPSAPLRPRGSSITSHSSEACSPGQSRGAAGEAPLGQVRPTHCLLPTLRPAEHHWVLQIEFAPPVREGLSLGSPWRRERLLLLRTRAGCRGRMSPCPEGALKARKRPH